MTFAGHTVPPVSTVADDVAHARGGVPGRLYCGRRRKDRAVTELRRVKCADCLAALRADGVIR